jgi:hypothetical protein
MLTRRNEVTVLLLPDGEVRSHYLATYGGQAVANLEAKEGVRYIAWDSKLLLIASNAQDEQARRGPASFCVVGTRREISHKFD